VLAVKGEPWGRAAGRQAKAPGVVGDLQEGAMELQMQCPRAACTGQEGGMLSNCILPLR